MSGWTQLMISKVEGGERGRRRVCVWWRVSSFPASTNIQKVKSAIQLYSIIVERLSSQPVSQSSAGFMFLQTTDCHTRHNLFTLQVLNISSLCTEVEMGGGVRARLLFDGGYGNRICLTRCQDISRGLWGDKARGRQSWTLYEAAF